jgi:molybdenum cofactor biosynthesis enzyme MoaA
MIAKTCRTCKHIRKDCDGTAEPCLSWRASRASLWAEIARLEAELECKREPRNARTR